LTYLIARKYGAVKNIRKFFLQLFLASLNIVAMSVELDGDKVKEKAVELAFAARTVIQQLAMKDRTREGFRAQEILEDALTRAILDGGVDHRAAAA
jgi:hypothetical protein